MTEMPPRTVTFTEGETSTTVDLYSEEGVRLISQLWMKQSIEYRRMYEPSWLGIPIIQLPEDMVQMQELLWRLRPDVVVETGVAHGGSLVLTASVLELLGHGRVLGVDVEIRKHNRVALDAHPLRHRITLYEGSSVAAETVARVEDFCRGARRVLVVLDSNHSTEHVLDEMRLYHRFVTPGSYLVAMDGAQAWAWDLPRGKPEWRDDNPLTAIHRFLPDHPEFEIDPHYTRMGITSSPDGFLRRRTLEELDR